MRRVRSRHTALNLPSLRLEGALFLPDQLEKAALGQAHHQTEADYGIPRGLKLKDEYSRAFQIAVAQWRQFENHLDRLDLDPTVVTQQFVVELLRDTLGYSQLARISGLTASERSYPVTALAGAVPVVIAPHNLELDEPDSRFAVEGGGSRRKSAFQLAQECLNAHPECLWALVSNGRQIRLLRDAATLTRPSYLEIDLQDVLGGQRYAEFAMAWRLLHASRSGNEANREPRMASGWAGSPNHAVFATDPSPLAIRPSLPCVWELWREAGSEEGTRVRDGLREGVTEALITLGEGFLVHPANEALRQALLDGTLTTDAFFQQILRLVYRLIFIFNIEERGLLHPQDDSTEAIQARRAYAEGYSFGKLRDYCLKRRARNRHDDRWQAARIVFTGLAHGESRLALPALGGLFAAHHCPDLDRASLDNAHWLAAFKALRWSQRDGVLVPVDYRNMGTEELGSVYESLLELVPEIDLTSRRFGFVGLTSEGSTAGNARKLTGSYYTPNALVQELIHSALDPVIEQRLGEAGRMANGQWLDVSPEYRKVFIGYVDSGLSRSRSLAARSATGPDDLSPEFGTARGGTVWPDLADAASGGLHSREHRGGLGKALSGGIHPVHPGSQWKSGGTGDAPDSDGGPEFSEGRTDSASHDREHGPRQTIAGAGTQPEFAPRDLASHWEKTHPSIRHSLFTAHALLSIRVIDPACGSGHFLLAAARRLAERLAQLRAPEGAVKPQDYRHALREVIGRCIFGVDRNPMAIELARMALWLEGYEEGRPLGFLDHHLQCGDALLGVMDLNDLQLGIPKDAYKPLSGDDKSVCKQLAITNAMALKDLEKKRKAHKLGQLDMANNADNLLLGLQAIETLPENTTGQIAAKEAAYRAFLEQTKTSRLAHAADLLVGAYLLPKREGAESSIPTSATLYLTLSGDGLPAEQQGALAAAQTACAEARVLHWPLAFPQVFASGGFDCVLGNPPWERIKLQEEEFFATRHRDVAEAKNKAERSQRIQWLAEGMLAKHLFPQLEHAPHECEAEQRLYAEFISARRTAEAASLFAHVKGVDGGRFPLTGVGDVNTYALFAETISQITHAEGRAGFIVPTGIATDDSTKAYFGALATGGRLASLYDFENREKIFEAVDSRMKFCLLTIGIGNEAEFSFFLTQTSQLSDHRRRFTLCADDFARINPNTLTCPVFRSRRDAELTRKIYHHNVVLRADNKEKQSWGIRLRTMFHKSADSELLLTAEDLRRLGANQSDNCSWITNDGARFLRVYEGKYGWQFNHRYASHSNGEDLQCDEEWLSNSKNLISPELYCAESEFWKRLDSMGLSEAQKNSAFLGFRRVSSSTNERTSVACIYPWLPSTYGWILTVGVQNWQLTVLCGAYNSLVFDYLLRNSLSQPSIPQGVFEQIAVPPIEKFDHSVQDFIASRVLELTYTASDMAPWAQSLGYQGAPFTYDSVRRAQLRAELDAYYAKLYGLSRDELRYILDPADVMGEDYPSETFRGLKKNEEREFGEYRTQRLVLEAWDKLERGELH